MDAATALPPPINWKSDEMAARRRARYAGDRRLQIYGIIAIAFALGFLAFLLGTLIFSGYKAFVQTKASVSINLAEANVDPNALMDANWRSILRDALRAQVGELSRSQEREYFSIFTSSAHYIVRDRVIADPALLSRTSTFEIPLSDPLDQLAKGEIDRNLPEDRRRVSDLQIGLFDQLEAKGIISQPFNWALFFNSDSRFPELAGLKGRFPVRSGRCSSASSSASRWASLPPSIWRSSRRRTDGPT